MAESVLKLRANVIEALGVALVRGLRLAAPTRDQLYGQRVALLVRPIALDIGHQLLAHADQYERRKDQADELGLVRAHRGEALKDHVRQIEAIDHFGELKEQTNWEEVPPCITRRFYLVRWIASVPLLVIVCHLFLIVSNF